MAKTARRCGGCILMLAAVCLGSACHRDQGQSKDAAVVPIETKPEPSSATQPIDAKVQQAAYTPGNEAKSFKEATLQDAPDGATRPPDMTRAGKSVGKIYELIVGPNGAGGLWDQVVFTTPEGKKIRYVAEVKTTLGSIHIEMLPHVAPNHVRNFLALARAGYYDGLAFDRVERQEVEGSAWAYLEAGCPLGTGDPGAGHIGYWLKPEFSDKVTHEEGTVGAWHPFRGEEADPAGTKFYVTLCKAPWMDPYYTVFGKIVQGLDVAQAISRVKVSDKEEDLGRPIEPVLIREIVVHATTLP